MRPFFVLLCAASALGACSEGSLPTDAGPDLPEAPAPCLANGGEVWMGAGVDASFTGFARFGANPEVFVTPGPQGGQHIWVQVRGRGIDTLQLRLHLKAFREGDNQLLGQLLVRLPLSPAPEDTSLVALPSQQIVLEDSLYCSVLREGRVRITMNANDGRGHCVDQEVVATVRGIDPRASSIDRMARERCCDEHLLRCFPDGGTRPLLDASLGGG